VDQYRGICNVVIKVKKKNTNLSEQFQNPISTRQPTFLAWYRHFNKNKVVGVTLALWEQISLFDKKHSYTVRYSKMYNIFVVFYARDVHLHDYSSDSRTWGSFSFHLVLSMFSHFYHRSIYVLLKFYFLMELFSLSFFLSVIF
jgi:hypothetical protein